MIGSSVSMLVVAAVTGLTPAPAAPPTPETQESFLLRADIVARRYAPEGITNSIRATLSDGSFTHDAQIQRIDLSKQSHPTSRGVELNFRDSWKYNVAAYRLSRLLGLDNVPVSVARKIGGIEGALTWWVDDVTMDERSRYLQKITPPNGDRWNRQIYEIRVFDELIYNTDRNLGNLLITSEWKIWMIDHTRAFRRVRQVRNGQQLERCSRRLYEGMKRLDEPMLAEHLGAYVGKLEREALLARRDEIVSFFERKISQSGEAAILFDWPLPTAAETAAVRH